VRTHALLAAVLASLAATYAVEAHAQPASPPVEEAQETTEAEPRGEERQEPPPEQPPFSPPSPSSPPPEVSRARTAFRVAAVGDYRGIYDLSALSYGLALSLGCDCEKAGGFAELRGMTGHTVGGLSVNELSLGGSAEFVLKGTSFVLGLGGALTVFSVQRATDRSQITSVGPELYGRLGYRFGLHSAPFVNLDFGTQLQDGGAWVWGPTLAVGYRF